MPFVRVPGRAHTAGEKRVIIERLYVAWLRAPELRLGQLLDNAVAGDGRLTLFNVEDEPLVTITEWWIEKHVKAPK
jgi:hypothetical protein